MQKISYQLKESHYLFTNARLYMLSHLNKANNEYAKQMTKSNKIEPQVMIEDYKSKQKRMEANLQASILNSSKPHLDHNGRPRMLPNSVIKRNKSKVKVDNKL